MKNIMKSLAIVTIALNSCNNPSDNASTKIQVATLEVLAQKETPAMKLFAELDSLENNFDLSHIKRTVYNGWVGDYGTPFYFAQDSYTFFLLNHDERIQRAKEILLKNVDDGEKWEFAKNHITYLWNNRFQIIITIHNNNKNINNEIRGSLEGSNFVALEDIEIKKKLTTKFMPKGNNKFREWDEARMLMQYIWGDIDAPNSTWNTQRKQEIIKEITGMMMPSIIK